MDDFELVAAEAPRPCEEGEVLLRPHLLSVDPTMRNSMAGRDAVATAKQTSSYFKSEWALGAPPSGKQVCIVMATGAGVTDFAAGDLVSCRGPWQTLHKAPAATLEKCEVLHKQATIPCAIRVYSDGLLAGAGGRACGVNDGDAGHW